MLCTITRIFEKKALTKINDLTTDLYEMYGSAKLYYLAKLCRMLLRRKLIILNE